MKDQTILDIDYRKSVNGTYLDIEDDYKFENSNPIVDSYTIYRMLINHISNENDK